MRSAFLCNCRQANDWEAVPLLLRSVKRTCSGVACALHRKISEMY